MTQAGLHGDVPDLGPLAAAYAGPSAAALGEQHQGQPIAPGEFVDPILLVVAPAALGSGDDHVVVVHGDGARPIRFEQVAVDVADAHHQAVRLGGFPQPLLLLPTRRGHQRPVFPERAVHQVPDVFAGAALLFRMPPRDLLGPEVVLDVGTPVVDLGEIATAGIVVDLAGWFRPAALDLRFGEQDQRVPDADRVAGSDEDRIDATALFRPNDVIEFQGVDCCHGLAGKHLVALGHVDGHHGAGHRGGQRDRAGGLGLVLLGFRRLHLRVVLEEGERIPGILDPCAGKAILGLGRVVARWGDEAR